MPQCVLTVVLVIAATLCPPASAQATQNTEPTPKFVRFVTPPPGEKTLNDYFNSALGPINTAVFTTLFFDVTFGVFKSDAVDKQGNPVFEQKRVLVEATQDFIATRTDSRGQPLITADGSPKRVEIKAGQKYQPLGPDGLPAFEDGDRKTTGASAPFLVVFLAAGAIFFTLYHKLINLRGFLHAIQIVRGKFSKDGDAGDIPPFRALTSALSATVGLGNIAGVAIAVKTGGPGAIFWMMALGLFGMTAKFHESTLAQLYRTTNPDGSVSGGPMYYIHRGFKALNPAAAGPGRVIAIVFAVFCMGAALGGGNMFQANQAFEGFYSQFVATPSVAEQNRDTLDPDLLRPLLSEDQLKAARSNPDTDLEAVRASLPEDRVRAILRPSQINSILDPDLVETDAQARDAQRFRVSIGFGITFAVLVAIVIIGGITRIGAATSKIVPTMCLLYVVGCLTVILFNLSAIPSHVALIFAQAFNPDAAFGGFIGVLIIGFQRAAFSSEAGLGSSAIAHSSAKQSEPVREGLVASLEPFIDTIVICFMTAMVVLITDAYVAPELVEESNGAAVTLFAFEQTRLGDWFPYVLSISIVLFAFSTMISWCYYGERAWGYLFGMKTVIVFRIAFVAAVFVGAVASLGPVIDFSDAMLLSMALPNIIGGVILAPLVKRKLTDYWTRYKSGDFTSPPQ